MKKCFFILTISLPFLFFHCFYDNENIHSINLFDESTQMINAGYKKIREQKYEEAAQAFLTAIDIDSSRSDAYYGYLLAIRFEKNLISSFRILKNLSFTNAINSYSLLVDSNLNLLNDYYQGSKLVIENLAPFILRDSLSDIYQKSLSYSPSDLTITSQQNDFIKRYVLNSTTNSILYDLTKQDLVDNYRNRFNISSDFTIINYMFYFTNYRNTNDDLQIDSNDNQSIVSEIDRILLNMATLPTLAAFPITYNSVRTLYETDVSNKQTINTIMVKLSQTEKITSLLTGDQKSPIQPLIDSNLGHFNYFLFEDTIDNDGDGCIDEENKNGIDDDGDGLIDEDTHDSPKSVQRPFFVQQATYNNSDNNLSHRDSILKLIQDSIPPYDFLTTEQRQYAKDNIGGCW